MTAFNEGFENGFAGGRRADNPYARGWARFSALVLPDSEAAVWDKGWQAGLKHRIDLCRIADKALGETMAIEVDSKRVETIEDMASIVLDFYDRSLSDLVTLQHFITKLGTEILAEHACRRWEDERTERKQKRR